jgi:hypothetical protein
MEELEFPAFDYNLDQSDPDAARMFRSWRLSVQGVSPGRASSKPLRRIVSSLSGGSD